MKQAQFKLDSFIYTIVIGAYAKLGQDEEMMKCYNEMKELQIQPDIRTYSILLGRLGNKSEFDKILQILDDMKKHNILPNQVTYYALLAAFEKSEQKMVETWEQMKKDGFQPDATVYSLILKSSYPIHDHIQFHDEMKKAGVVSDIAIYNKILERIGKSNKLNEITHFLDLMKKEEIKPNEKTKKNLQHIDAEKREKLLSIFN